MNACFWNLLIAILDPIDRVQPRSKATCWMTVCNQDPKQRVGWLARFNGDWCHPCSVSRGTPCSSPDKSRARGIVSKAGIPIVWFPRLAISLFWLPSEAEKTRLISTFLALSFLVLASACVLITITASTLFRMMSAKAIFKKKALTFRKIFLASLSFGPPSTIFLSLPFRISCLFFNKESSSCSFESTSAFSFSFASPSPHLPAPERSRLPSILVVVPCPKTRSCIINVTLLTGYSVCGPLSKFVFNKVFYNKGSARAAALSVHSEWRILHWTFRRTEQFHKYCPYCFKCVSSDIHSLEREWTRKSLSLGFTERALATMNINGVKLSLSGNDISWLDTCVACQWSLVAWTLESRGSSFLLSFNVFWGHVSEILTISLFLAHDGQW